MLNENKLIELPVSINKLKNLILLNLKNNKLTNQPIGWFTYQYTEADRVKLEKLDLDGNKLTELPAEISDLRELRELSMSNNQLVGLPTSIQRLTKLKLAVLEWK